MNSSDADVRGEWKCSKKHEASVNDVVQKMDECFRKRFQPLENNCFEVVKIA